MPVCCTHLSGRSSQLLFTNTHLCHCSQTLTSVTVHRHSPLSMFTDTYLCHCSQTLTSAVVHTHLSLCTDTCANVHTHPPLSLFTDTHLCRCSQSCQSHLGRNGKSSASPGRMPLPPPHPHDWPQGHCCQQRSNLQRPKWYHPGQCQHPGHLMGERKACTVWH